MIQFYSSRPTLGGSQVVVLQYADALRSVGKQVRIAGVAAQPNPFLDKASGSGFRIEPVEPPGIFRSYNKAYTKLSKVSVARGVAATPYYYARQATRLRSSGVQAVCVATSRCVLQYGPAVRLAGLPLIYLAQGGLSVGTRWMRRAIVTLPTAVTCVSEAVKENIIYNGRKRSDDIRVILNGIPDSEHVSDGCASDYILFAGNVVPEKGVHNLIKSYAGLRGETKKRYKLLVAGKVWDPQYGDFVRDLARGHDVEFLGFRRDIAELMAGASMLVAPSIEDEMIQYGGSQRRVVWKEGFCLSALEGMRAGVPVVASESYGIKEVVDDRVTGLLVEPSSVTSLAEAMQYLLDHPDRSAAMGAAGRERYLKWFRAERMRDEFVEFIEQVT